MPPCGGPNKSPRPQHQRHSGAITRRSPSGVKSRVDRGVQLTAAGARAIAIDDSSASDETSEGTDPRLQVTTTGSEIVKATADVPAAAPSLSAPRGGTKLARVLELLQRDCGATLEELIAATDWLPHTTRAALTGLRKRGYAVTIDRHDKERGSTYRARLGETIETGGATGQSDAPPAISLP